VGAREHVIRELQDTGAFVVPVCFHVIRPGQDSTNESDTVFLDTASLQRQPDVLNQAFRSLAATRQRQVAAKCSILDTGVFEIGFDRDPTEDTVSQAPSRRRRRLSPFTSECV
jgi:hypothetical protein